MTYGQVNFIHNEQIDTVSKTQFYRNGSNLD
jgi:hypothetical protein